MCIGYYWLALAHNSTDMPCSYQQLDTWVCEDAGGLVMMFCNNTVTTELEKKSVKYMCFTLTLRSYLLPVVMVVVCHCMKPFTLFFTRYFLHKYSSSRLHKYLKCCVQSTADIRICSVSVGGSIVTFPVQCDLDCFLSVFGAISFRCVCWRDETVCLFIYFFFFFCFFYSHTDLCTQSCSVFFFFSMLSITRDFSWCHDSQGVSPALLWSPTDGCFDAMCLLLLFLTDCTLTSATITMLSLQLTQIGPCINAQRQESVWG